MIYVHNADDNNNKDHDNTNFSVSSFRQRWHGRLRKAHKHSVLSLSSLLKVALKAVGLVEHMSSAASFLHFSFIQTTCTVML